MNRVVRGLVCGAAAAALVAGCAKAPVQEMSDAKSAVEASVAAGADKYAAQELAQAQAVLASAEAEVRAQEAKTFKNYDKAKEILAKAKAEAEAVKASVPARKEAARNAALAAESEARAALDEAKALLANAPKGKGTRADIEAFAADLKGVEDALPEIQGMISAEDYFGAEEKARALGQKAAAVSTEVAAAMQKLGK